MMMGIVCMLRFLMPVATRLATSFRLIAIQRIIKAIQVSQHLMMAGLLLLGSQITRKMTGMMFLHRFMMRVAVL